MSATTNRLAMAAFILSVEARRDGRGRLAVYKLPSGDGGGTFEVAGINDRYHPKKANELRVLIELGKFNEAEKRAVEYLASYTDVAGEWTLHAKVEAFLRDCCFNRGAGGAAWIYQHALDVKTDGKVGPVTKLAGVEITEDELPGFLMDLRESREVYERQVVKRNEKSKFWKGLVNRWDKALKFASEF